MSHDSRVVLIQETYEAFKRGEPDFILEAVTADVQWETVGRPADFPTFGLRTGLEGVQAFFRAVWESEEFDTFAPASYHATEDRVFVEGSAQGRLKPSGRAVSFDWLHVYTLRDGKIARFREFLDTAQFADAWRA
ncbi:MAG: ketosteroid isomerase-like protein [Caulobacter sp.]|nr:ketosteroid isomerase-like protein [Caulobacter sp.]